MVCDLEERAAATPGGGIHRRPGHCGHEVPQPTTPGVQEHSRLHSLERREPHRDTGGHHLPGQEVDQVVDAPEVVEVAELPVSLWRGDPRLRTAGLRDECDLSTSIRGTRANLTGLVPVSVEDGVQGRLERIGRAAQKVPEIR